MSEVVVILDNHFIDLASSFASFNSNNSSATISYLRLHTALLHAMRASCIRVKIQFMTGLT